MKRIFAIFLLYFLSSVIYGQTKGPVILITESSSFAQINSAGEPKRLKELCEKCEESIHSGTVNYKKASVALIRDCRVSYQIFNDSIKSYKLETINPENSKTLMGEAFKAFGPPTKSTNDVRQSVYSWEQKTSSGLKVISVLTITRNYSRGVFLSTVE